MTTQTLKTLQRKVVSAAKSLSAAATPDGLF